MNPNEGFYLSTTTNSRYLPKDLFFAEEEDPRQIEMRERNPRMKKKKEGDDEWKIVVKLSSITF